MSNHIINVVALVSGRGTNLQAIIDQIQSGRLPIKLCAVISDKPDAQGLLRAEAAGIATQRVVREDYESRNLFEQALIQSIDSHQPDLVLLAGFMRVLSNAFVEHYAGRLMNIHPSLLPAYPGLNTHARALADDARQHGATVHFVTEHVDAGPVIIQATVPVKAGDSAETLAARVLEQEHRIYPQAIRWFAEHKLQIVDNQVLLDGRQQSQQGLITRSRPIKTPD
jgi:phosphoribosylglycinamide formyltransferase 1